MEKSVELLLRRIFPDREFFEDGEVSLAEGIVRALSVSSERASALPTRFVEVGEVFAHCGKMYRCVKAPKVHPSEACSGCDISRKYGNCNPLQCSPFDRRDGNFVWYLEVEG